MHVTQHGGLIGTNLAHLVVADGDLWAHMSTRSRTESCMAVVRHAGLCQWCQQLSMKTKGE